MNTKDNDPLKQYYINLAIRQLRLWFTVCIVTMVCGSLVLGLHAPIIVVAFVYIAAIYCVYKAHEAYRYLRRWQNDEIYLSIEMSEGSDTDEHETS